MVLFSYLQIETKQTESSLMTISHKLTSLYGKSMSWNRPFFCQKCISCTCILAKKNTNNTLSSLLFLDPLFKTSLDQTFLRGMVESTYNTRFNWNKSSGKCCGHHHCIEVSCQMTDSTCTINSRYCTAPNMEN